PCARRRLGGPSGDPGSALALVQVLLRRSWARIAFNQERHDDRSRSAEDRYGSFVRQIAVPGLGIPAGNNILEYKAAIARFWPAEVSGFSRGRVRDAAIGPPVCAAPQPSRRGPRAAVRPHCSSPRTQSARHLLSAG